MESKIRASELVNFCKRWSYSRRNSFYLWSIDEIVQEACLQSLYLLKKHDPEISPWSAYLSIYLYSRVHWAYVGANQIKVSKGKGKRRSYTRANHASIEAYKHTLPAPMENEEEVYMDSLPNGFEDLAEYLQRGLNQRQIAHVLGVTESRVSQRMSLLRKIMSQKAKKK